MNSPATAAELANGAQTRKNVPLGPGNEPKAGEGGWAKAVEKLRQALSTTNVNRFIGIPYPQQGGEARRGGAEEQHAARTAN